MLVRVKKLSAAAVIPEYSKLGDAGMDLTAISMEKDDNGNVVYGTGLAIEIPKGHVGLIFPRSSNSKTDLYLTNHVGVIDSGYRGEIMFKFRANPSLINAKIYHPGDRVGQLIIIPYPHVYLVETDELSGTERGEGGFGSTGK
jgi:dUTP pyrophosphatase